MIHSFEDFVSESHRAKLHPDLLYGFHCSMRIAIFPKMMGLHRQRFGLLIRQILPHPETSDGLSLTVLAVGFFGNPAHIVFFFRGFTRLFACCLRMP